jgi:hypothetical protein
MREFLILAVGALFGLGATMTAMVGPSYLNLPLAAQHWLFWGGIALMAIMGLDAVALFFGGPRTPTAVFANLALVFIACTAISYFRPLFPSQPAIKTSDAEISVQCHKELLPKTFGPNEIINVLALFPLPLANGGGGVAQQSNHSGKDWQWRINNNETPFGGIVGKCEITNYGNGPVIDFRMFLDLAFYEAVPAPNQKNSISMGDLKLRRPWSVSAPKIDTGPSNSFTFYIYNSTSDHVVNVILPKTAELRRLGEPKTHEVKLDIPQIGGEIPLDFWPLDRLPKSHE